MKRKAKMIVKEKLRKQAEIAHDTYKAIVEGGAGEDLEGLGRIESAEAINAALAMCGHPAYRFDPTKEWSRGQMRFLRHFFDQFQRSASAARYFLGGGFSEYAIERATFDELMVARSIALAMLGDPESEIDPEMFEIVELPDALWSELARVAGQIL